MPSERPSRPYNRRPKSLAKLKLLMIAIPLIIDPFFLEQARVT